MENPFANLGELPPESDPQGRLDWLQAVIEALRDSRDPKLKPVRKKFAKTLHKLERGTKVGQSQEALAAQLDRDIRELQIDTYGMLLRSMQQLQGVVKVKVVKGREPDPETGKVLAEIEALSKGLKRLLNAMKKGDKPAEAAARAALSKAGRSESG